MRQGGQGGASSWRGQGASHPPGDALGDELGFDGRGRRPLPLPLLLTVALLVTTTLRANTASAGRARTAQHSQLGHTQGKQPWSCTPQQHHRCLTLLSMRQWHQLPAPSRAAPPPTLSPLAAFLPSLWMGRGSTSKAAMASRRSLMALYKSSVLS